jgi:hypothetical protein
MGNLETDDNPGLIPRISDVLFKFIRESASDRIITAEGAYLEIYNEKVRAHPTS